MASSTSTSGGKPVLEANSTPKTESQSSSQPKNHMGGAGKPTQAEATTKTKLESSGEPKRHATATKTMERSGTNLTTSKPKACSIMSPKPKGAVEQITGNDAGSKRNARVTQANNVKRTQVASKKGSPVPVAPPISNITVCSDSSELSSAPSEPLAQLEEDESESESESLDLMAVEDFNPSPDRCGLLNHGNSNYFNAVIQALFSLDVVVDHCMASDKKIFTGNDFGIRYQDRVAAFKMSSKDSSVEVKRAAVREAYNEAKHQFSCTAQLGVYFNFMKQLSSVDPATLMNVVGALTANEEFEGYNGQFSKEPREFLSALLELLVNEEMTDYRLFPGQEDRTVLGSLFRGVIGQKAKCKRCGKTSSNSSCFCCPLVINIPLDTEEISLQKCLDVYTAATPQKMREHRCQGMKFRKHTTGEMRVFIEDVPDCLVIQVNRLESGIDDLRKIGQRLVIPTGPLDISKWSRESGGGSSGVDSQYEVTAVVGDNRHGHYTTLRKLRSGEWVLFDDNYNPTELSLIEVASEYYNGCLVFLKRIE